MTSRGDIGTKWQYKKMGPKLRGVPEPKPEYKWVWQALQQGQ